MRCTTTVLIQISPERNLGSSSIIFIFALNLEKDVGIMLLIF